MTIILLLLFAVLACASEAPEGRPACRVRPQTIEVGPFYDGVVVTIEGAVDTGSNVVVTVTGSDREEQFNRKGRFGPIWLNSGRVRISGVPSLFLRFSAGPVGTILNRASIAEHGFDKNSLMQRMRAEPRGLDTRGDARIGADYLALKEADGVYAFGDGGIHMAAPDGQRTPFALQFHWPKKAPPAVYQVHVYEARDGAVTREISVPIEVVRTGFPAWIAGVADNRPSLYGITAVLAGAFAGFGIDFLATRIFRKKRSAAH